MHTENKSILPVDSKPGHLLSSYCGRNPIFSQAPRTTCPLDLEMLGSMLGASRLSLVTGGQLEVPSTSNEILQAMLPSGVPSWYCCSLLAWSLASKAWLRPEKEALS